MYCTNMYGRFIKPHPHVHIHVSLVLCSRYLIDPRKKKKKNKETTEGAEGVGIWGGGRGKEVSGDEVRISIK